MYNQPTQYRQPNIPQLPYLNQLNAPYIGQQMTQFCPLILEAFNLGLQGIASGIQHPQLNQDIINFILANNFNSAHVDKVINRLASFIYFELNARNTQINIIQQMLPDKAGEALLAEFARSGQAQRSGFYGNPQFENMLMGALTSADQLYINTIEPFILQQGQVPQHNQQPTQYQTQPMQSHNNAMPQYNSANNYSYTKPPSFRELNKNTGNDFAVKTNPNQPQPTIQTRTDVSKITPTDTHQVISGVNKYTRSTLLSTTPSSMEINNYELASNEHGVFINEDNYRPNESEIETVAVQGYSGYFGSFFKGDSVKPEKISTLKDFSDRLMGLVGTLDIDRYSAKTKQDFISIGEIGLGFYGNLFKSAIPLGGFGFKSKPFGVLKHQLEMASEVLGANWQDVVDLERHVKIIHFQGKECYIFSSQSDEVYRKVALFRGCGMLHHRYNVRATDASSNEYHWYILNHYFNTNTIVEDLYLEDPTMDLKKHIGLAEPTPVAIIKQPVVERVEPTEAAEPNTTSDLNIEVTTQRIVASSAREALNRHVVIERLKNGNYTTENKHVVIQYERTEPFLLRSVNDVTFMSMLKSKINTTRISLNELVTLIRNAYYGEAFITTDLLQWLDSYLGRRVVEHFVHSFGLPALTLDAMYIEEHDQLIEMIRKDVPETFYNEWVQEGQFDFITRCFKFAEGQDLEAHKLTLLNRTNIPSNEELDTIEVEANVVTHEAPSPTKQQLASWSGMDIEDLVSGPELEALIEAWSAENAQPKLSPEWLELDETNFVVIKETIQLTNTPYLLSELGLSPSVEISGTVLPRRICGQNAKVTSLVHSIDTHKRFEKLYHHQLLTKDGFVIDVYRSPADSSIVNYVLADAR